MTLITRIREKTPEDEGGLETIAVKLIRPDVTRKQPVAVVGAAAQAPASAAVATAPDGGPGPVAESIAEVPSEDLELPQEHQDTQEPNESTAAKCIRQGGCECMLCRGLRLTEAETLAIRSGSDSSAGSSFLKPLDKFLEASCHCLSGDEEPATPMGVHAGTAAANSATSSRKEAGRKPLTCRESKSPEEINAALQEALKNRAVDSTSMNSESSRSHFVFTMTAFRHAAKNSQGKEMCSVTVVDLAGNEHGATRSDNRDLGRGNGDERSSPATKPPRGRGNQWDVGTDINMSLLALNHCLQSAAGKSAVKSVNGKNPGSAPVVSVAPGEQQSSTRNKFRARAVPGVKSRPGSYRDHALTRMLQRPLTGAKVLFVGTVHQGARHRALTKSTLDYMSQARLITNDAEARALISLEAMAKQKKGIKFVAVQAVAQKKQLMRSDDAERSGAILIPMVIRVKVVKIFFSHRWLTPFYNGSPLKPATWFRGKEEAHPDAEGHPKCDLLLHGIRKMVDLGWIPAMSDLAIWYDFACVDQVRTPPTPPPRSPPPHCW